MKPLEESSDSKFSRELPTTLDFLQQSPFSQEATLLNKSSSALQKTNCREYN